LPWTLSSDRSGGSKVCTVRLESAHLFHTGVGSAWSQEEVEAFLTDGVMEAGKLRSGAMRPPSPRPAEVSAWGEALRFGHEEIWANVPGLGTTLVAHEAGHLWVLSLGVHRVRVVGGADGGEPVAGEPAEWGGELWRLDASLPWTIEVRLEEDLPPLWVARWRREPDRAPAPVPEPAPAASVGWLRRPWPGWAPHALWAAVLAAGLAALFILPIGFGRRLAEGWRWSTDFLGARYRLSLTSYPAGAAILVDGEDTGEETPAEIHLVRGRHRVGLSLGSFGSVEIPIEGRRAERLSRHADLLGSLVVGTADTTLAVHARLDGRPVGRVPVRLDSVAAGRRNVSFQGRDVRPWSEEVDVVAGRITQITIHPERVPDHGVVVARSYRVSPSGLTEVEGATVFLDGRRVGSTPARFEVPRGYHTVRLRHGDEDSPVQLLRVEGGGELYATAEFGRSPEPRVRVAAPERLSLSDPEPVVAGLESATAVRVRQMHLYWRPPGLDYERRAMALDLGTSGLAGSLVPPADSTLVGKTVHYFVVVETDQGEEFVSEVGAVRIQR
jgi:hypothetical protein